MNTKKPSLGRGLTALMGQPERPPERMSRVAILSAILSGWL